MKCLIVLISAVLLVTPSQSIEVIPCDGIAAPSSVIVEGCEKTPCKFETKDHVKIQYTFSVPSYTTSLKPLVKAKYLGVEFDNDPNVQGCNSLAAPAKCPLEANQTVTYKVDREIERTRPGGDYLLTYRLHNQDEQVIVCFKLPLDITYRFKLW